MIRWRYITADEEHADRALASDEFLMSKYACWSDDAYPEPSIRIYTFRNHCAIIGRFQSLDAEVRTDECLSRGIEINRRATGGGGVLMGRQQLMIAIASATEHPSIPAHPGKMLPKLSKGIIAGLENLGIKAEFRLKNDIVVNGRKIGGTAICIAENGSLLYQATLMVDFDIDLMLKVLSIPPEKISDKTTNSYAERLTTVSAELGRPIDMEIAREAVCRGFEKTFKMSAAYSPFTDTELEQIEDLSRSKYSQDVWLYQRQPDKDMLGICIKKTPAGLVCVYVSLSGDMIKSVMIAGDFFSGNRVINDVEAALKWGRAEKDSIMRTISVVMKRSGSSIQGISAGELSDIVSQAAINARRNE